MSELIDKNTLSEATSQARTLLNELDSILLGRSELHHMIVVAILSRGHVLLEGVPGVGKTAMIKALGEILELEFKRAQFTPDLMPGDILGTNILQESAAGRRELLFQPGPIFTNILLADEINRASPKTQSALLEAMQERSVTLLGTTRKLPEPFFVLASQNPIELEGTYPLPEAQLDRFLFKLNVATVDAATLADIISSRRRGEPPKPSRTIPHNRLQQLFDAVDRIYLPKAIANYIGRLVESTHANSTTVDEVKNYVTFGASPRAAIAMAEAARAEALLDGRPTVGFSDVKKVAAAALNHRLILNYRARLDGVTPMNVVDALLARIEEASLGLPSDVEVAMTGASPRA
jgi:MoxR-like ATPase